MKKLLCLLTTLLYAQTATALTYDVIGDSVVNEIGTVNSNWPLQVPHAMVGRQDMYVGQPGDRVIAWYYYGYSDALNDTLRFSIWTVNDTLIPEVQVSDWIPLHIPINSFTPQRCSTMSDTVALDEGITYCLVPGCATTDDNMRVWLTVGGESDTLARATDSTCGVEEWVHFQFSPFGLKIWALVEHAPPPPTIWARMVLGRNQCSGRFE